MNGPVKTKQELLLRLHAHGDEIRSFGVTRIGIFGSFVRDEANAESDVDLLVEISPDRKTLKNFIALPKNLNPLQGGG